METYHFQVFFAFASAAYLVSSSALGYYLIQQELHPILSAGIFVAWASFTISILFALGNYFDSEIQS